ncbi:hemolysin family protein [Aureibaculum sp. 2210JD6-5]|uniref:hemolysin family protein n=1 Tax=Aureibaculum sp. 2210JD6-5 TaxID=3103957 RepID=UPI002AAEF936|nr:hemolysin family protein [Aureibaculum sp. 2210JD6-5]MDY7394778.1 hemolysin family protein [Aureibaculum sp. 2210JD6-5]
MESQIIIIIISILLSAFFSGMEIAFVSANKMHIELEKKKDTFLARILTKLTNNPSKFITTMLVGNNIALVVYGYFMGELLMPYLAPYLYNDFVILLVQTLISTLIILVTAEFLPKAIFRVYANETLKIFAIPAYIFFLLFYFISSFIMVISDFVLRVFFNTREDDVQLAFTKAELGDYINEQLEISDDEVDSEIQIFQNALDFHNVRARDAMIPRTDIVAIDVTDSVKNLKNLFVETGLSKIIVYKDSLDDVIGYIHAFELFKNPKTIRSLLLPIETVPETMMINNILNDLTKKQKSVAVVIDEYGGTSGLITIEDIIEELFGDIEDEHDTIELLEKKINDREFEFSARLEVDYINETYNLTLPESDAYETLGGLIVDVTENIPQKEEIIEIDSFQFTILEVSSSKIEQVYLKVLFKED